MEQAIRIPAGDTPAIQIQIDVAGGGTFDPTGATGYWQVGRANYSAGDDLLIQKSTETDGGAQFVVDEDEVAFLVVEMDRADTENLPPGAYFHQGLIEEADGTRSTIVWGTFEIAATIIREPVAP
jgi:hypothetical protein